MPSGGARTGRPGGTYANRRDMRSGGDAQYGDNVNKEAVQQATPGSPMSTTPTGIPGGVGPGDLVSLDAPSMRPDEPVTAGLPIGAGPGPADGNQVVNQDLWRLRALAQRYQSPELLKLIAIAESRL
jgi:hypothetical protein